MKRFIGNLFIAALVLAVLSFFAAPAVAFFAIRSAAEARDVQGLARLVDYTAVRASLRPQLSVRVEAARPAPSFLDDPIGAVRRQFQDNPMITRGPDTDAWLTPDALAGLTSGEGREAIRTQAVAAGKPLPTPRYWGINRARLSVGRPGSLTLFTFERRGPFEWRLVHIGLPDAAALPVPRSATP